jgi:hypothetical protein
LSDVVAEVEEEVFFGADDGCRRCGDAAGIVE